MQDQPMGEDFISSQAYEPLDQMPPGEPEYNSMKDSLSKMKTSVFKYNDKKSFERALNSLASKILISLCSNSFINQSLNEMTNVQCADDLTEAMTDYAYKFAYSHLANQKKHNEKYAELWEELQLK